MKKIFFASRFISTGEYDINIPVKLEYYMLNYKILASNSCIECYGVEVIKKYVDDTGNEVSQKSTVKNITYDKKEIYNILRLLYSCSITPMNLDEVIDEYISLAEQHCEKQA